MKTSPPRFLRSALTPAALLPLVAAAGCAIARQDTNEPLDAEAIRRFVPGTTTAREVVEQLGAPTEVVQLGHRSVYRYDATTAKSAVLILVLFNMGNQDQRSDRLWVFFDDRDVLTHYGATFGVHRTQYALPWEDIHEAEDNASRDADRPGVGR
ncbi:MAG: hypothetical protein KDE27_03955 [Planctomycetes bacterium]|nr:hypothetical protein [Planctomycetota bacterium]